MQMNGNYGRHPPLRRVSRGRRVSITIGPQQSIEPMELTNNVMELKPKHGAELQDSCYSSCSDSTDSHPSLSRETSDTLAQELSLPDTLLACNTPNYSTLLEFTLRLGYTEAQLNLALAQLMRGANIQKIPEQDQVLSELIKLNKNNGGLVANGNTNRDRIINGGFLRVGSEKRTRSDRQLCPYGRKCTFGNKCKFAHPERPGGIQQSVTDRLIQNRVRRPLSATVSLDPRMLSNPVPYLPPAINTNTPQSQCASQSSGVSIECVSSDCASDCSPTPSDPSPSTTDSGIGLNRLCVPPAWPWSHHQQITRVNSAPQQPISTLLSAPVSCLKNQTQAGHQLLPPRTVSFCTSDNQLPSRVNGATGNDPSEQHFFVPSSTVWGQPEFSLLPNRSSVSTSSHLATNSVELDFEEQRVRVEYHLSQLFPQQAVQLVMKANPLETNSQRLCARVMAYLKGDST